SREDPPRRSRRLRSVVTVVGRLQPLLRPLRRYGAAARNHAAHVVALLRRTRTDARDGGRTRGRHAGGPRPLPVSPQHVDEGGGRLMKGPTCYLHDLFTLDSERGKGVGRALIEAVYAAAKAAHAERVYWLTHESNRTAMQLYDKVADLSGFVVYRKPL